MTQPPYFAISGNSSSTWPCDGPLKSDLSFSCIGMHESSEPSFWERLVQVLDSESLSQWAKALLSRYTYGFSSVVNILQFRNLHYCCFSKAVSSLEMLFGMPWKLEKEKELFGMIFWTLWFSSKRILWRKLKIIRIRKKFSVSSLTISFSSQTLDNLGICNN